MLYGPQQIFLISFKKANEEVHFEMLQIISVEKFSFWLNSDHEPLQYQTTESI